MVERIEPLRSAWDPGVTLCSGARAVVAGIYPGHPPGCEIEFVDGEGHTIAFETLHAKHLRHAAAQPRSRAVEAIRQGCRAAPL